MGTNSRTPMDPKDSAPLICVLRTVRTTRYCTQSTTDSESILRGLHQLSNKQTNKSID